MFNYELSSTGLLNQTWTDELDSIINANSLQLTNTNQQLGQVRKNNLSFHSYMYILLDWSIADRNNKSEKIINKSYKLTYIWFQGFYTGLLMDQIKLLQEDGSSLTNRQVQNIWKRCLRIKWQCKFIKILAIIDCNFNLSSLYVSDQDEYQQYLEMLKGKHVSRVRNKGNKYITYSINTIYC